MTTPSSRSNLFHAGVMTVAILAAVSLSSEARAWGDRAGAFAGREHTAAAAGATGTAEERKGKWKGKFAKPAAGATTGAPAAATAQAPAAGGWRARMQQHQQTG